MDERYTINREFTGDKEIQLVVRFCGDWVGCAPTLKEAELIESSHVAKRGFDVVANHDGFVLWLKHKKKNRVVYGAELFETKDTLLAAEKFGQFLHHYVECEGKLN